MPTNPPPVPPTSSAPAGGAVSLLRFMELYGESHRAELDALWADADTEYLVLFANDTGDQLAILTVGPKHDYTRLADAVGRELDGLHAICHTPALGVPRGVSSAPVWGVEDQDLKLLAGSCPETAETLADSIRAARAAGLNPFRAALAHLAVRLADIGHRERYVEETENKLSDRAQAITEHIAELEQREAELMSRAASFERKVKESRHPFDVDIREFSLPGTLR